jgi:hypothetical protein
LFVYMQMDWRKRFMVGVLEEIKVYSWALRWGSLITVTTEKCTIGSYLVIGQCGHAVYNETARLPGGA